MSVPFYKAIVIGENEYEFFQESRIFLSLELAYHECQNILGAKNVYGYVIVKVDENSWEVINETVYGCDYSVYCDQKGNIKVKKGLDRLVMV